jgi:hypothetical protein
MALLVGSRSEQERDQLLIPGLARVGEGRPASRVADSRIRASLKQCAHHGWVSMEHCKRQDGSRLQRANMVDGRSVLDQGHGNVSVTQHQREDEGGDMPFDLRLQFRTEA